ncbi:unnamed protein product, partial [Oikopleura dioica]
MRVDLAILAINGARTDNMRLQDATQYIKECGRNGYLQLTCSNQAHLRSAEDLNAVLGNISTIPSIYREENDDQLDLRPLDLGEFKGITHSRLPDIKSFKQPISTPQRQVQQQPEPFYQSQPVHTPQATYEEPVSYTNSTPAAPVVPKSVKPPSPVQKPGNFKTAGVVLHVNNPNSDKRSSTLCWVNLR